jgi:hypothetical protein
MRQWPWLQGYDRAFAMFLISVLAVFLWIRPLNKPSQPVIAGDGLGYYAYLPAIFLHNDHDLQFRWFNAVHDKHYTHTIFPNPEDNFIVHYKGKRINKYYPGLSFAWLPFFGLGHLAAMAGDYERDGFSQPYQLAIALAALFYLFAGLILLRRLLILLGSGARAATISTAAVFYGTHLFAFGINVNSLTHVYSFCFVALFIYQLVRINERASAERLLYALLFFMAGVFIRPLNGLVLLVIPAFIQRFRFVSPRFSRAMILPAVLIVLMFCYQLAIMYRQTGSPAPYTYPGEGFRFPHSRFFDGLVSCHMGLFTYVPLFFIALFGLPWLTFRMRFITAGVFLVALYIYGAWWYWPITPRGLIDYYPLPAIWLAALLNRPGRRARLLVEGLVLVSVAYYQLKHYQLSVGALDHWSTTREIFFRNFFRLKKAWMYPVPPSTVRSMESHRVDPAENAEAAGEAMRFGGRRAVSISDHQYIRRLLDIRTDSSLKRVEGRKLIRLGLILNARRDAGALHLFVRLKDAEGKVITDQPFYLNEGDVPEDEWDLREFGFEVPEAQFGRTAGIEVIAWNLKPAREIFADDISVDVYVCDDSFETHAGKP